MPELKTLKMPTAVATLDVEAGGGLPVGSLVALIGEPGSGHYEFAYTSAIMTAVSKATSGESEKKEIVRPQEVCYISFSRTQDDIVSELYNGHTADLCSIFEEQVKFVDMSESYYKHPAISSDTTGEGAGKDVLAELLTTLEARPKHSLIILHTLSDLARVFHAEPAERFTLYLLALRKAVRKTGSVAYGLTGKGVLGKRGERSVIDASDGVFSFGWREAGSSERKRVMHIDKFRGLLTHMGESVPVFDVSVSPQVGFAISKVTKITKVA